jgi:hypothetical protein
MRARCTIRWKLSPNTASAILTARSRFAYLFVSALHFLTKKAEGEAIENEEVVNIEVHVLATTLATGACLRSANQQSLEHI